MRIGLRTIKTAIGVSLAIFIAQVLGLKFVVSTGMITFMCIQPTLKESMKTFISRIIGAALAIFFSFSLFYLLGKEPFVIGILLLILIPLNLFLKIHQGGGIGTSATITLQIYNSSTLNFALIIQIALIVAIGMTVAFLINLYMPSGEKNLAGNKQLVQEQFCRILYRIGQILIGEEVVGLDEEIKKADRLIKSAKALGFREMANDIFHEDDTYYNYFTLKEKQMSILKRMNYIVGHISFIYENNVIVAEFLEIMSEKMRPGDTTSVTYVQFSEMKERFLQLPLPITTEEFETRAHLMNLIYELDRYIFITERAKKTFKEVS